MHKEPSAHRALAVALQLREPRGLTHLDFPGRVMKCAANKKRRVTLACVAHGITLPAKSRIRRSGRSSPLPYPPLRLKASS